MSPEEFQKRVVEAMNKADAVLKERGLNASNAILRLELENGVPVFRVEKLDKPLPVWIENLGKKN